jgi:hypothetical protein
MKRAALYLRVSTVDRQNPETQGIELRQFTRLRGYEVVQEYVDHGVSRTKVRRPALEQLLNDAHRRKFDAVLVWLCDRRARSTEHFLQVLDELGIQFHSQREAIDTEVPLGRAIDVDRKALVRDRVAGMSLTCVAKKYGLSRASVVRFVHKGKRCQETASPLDTKVE